MVLCKSGNIEKEFISSLVNLLVLKDRPAVFIKPTLTIL